MKMTFPSFCDAAATMDIPIEVIYDDKREELFKKVTLDLSLPTLALYMAMFDDGTICSPQFNHHPVTRSNINEPMMSGFSMMEFYKKPHLSESIYADGFTAPIVITPYTIYKHSERRQNTVALRDITTDEIKENVWAMPLFDDTSIMSKLMPLLYIF